MPRLKYCHTSFCSILTSGPVVVSSSPNFALMRNPKFAASASRFAIELSHPATEGMRETVDRTMIAYGSRLKNVAGSAFIASVGILRT